MTANIIITAQDRMDAADASMLGISINDYRDAKVLIAAGKRHICRDEILRTVDRMHLTKSLCSN